MRLASLSAPGLFSASLLASLLGCADPAPAIPPPPPITPSTRPAPPAPSSPCSVDADCRLETVDGCGCIVVLSSSPPGPGCAHPCFAYPCMDRAARCDTSTHACVVRPEPTEAPPPS